MKATKSTFLYFVNYLFIFLLFISCQELEDISPERDYPRVSTGVITRIDETGISVTGEILSLGKAPVIEHGFIWSIKPKGEIHNSEVVSLGAIAKTGAYNTDINFALEKDKEYSIKAYAKTDQLTVYGLEITFTSQGSLPPIISDFSPKTGTWGDTITVVGKNFATSSAVAQVTLDGQKADIFSASSTSFKFVVPTTVSAVNNFVKISVYGASSTSAAPFILKQPRVFSSARTNGWLGDTLTITGEFLGPDPRSYIVYFNEAGSSRFVSANYNQIKVIVPDFYSTDEVCDIIIKNKYYTLKSPQQFTLDKPKIKSVSPSEVTFTSPFIIEGENFYPHSNQIFLGNSVNPIHVTASNYNKISVALNKYSLIPDRTVDVYLSVMGRKAEGKGTITIKEKWLRQTDESTTSIHENIFSRDNKIYRVQYKLSEFDPTSNSWVDLSSIPYPYKYKTATFTLDNKIFIGSGGSDYYGNSDFWKYDLALRQWKKLANFPGITNLYTSGFTLNGQGYFLTGNSIDNFWRYNLQEDRWEKLPNLPLKSQGRINTFVKNGNVYVVRTSNNKAELWEFNPVTVAWTQKNDPPQGLNLTNNGSIGPYAVLGTDEISLIGNNRKYSYDYIQDKWKEDLNFTQDFSGLTVKYGFFINDFTYINVSSATGNIGLYKTER